MVRYADQAVLGFQKHRDAIDCLKSLRQRLGKFGMKVHPAKNRSVRSAGFALKNDEELPARGNPDTFDFFWVSRTKSGDYIPVRMQ